MIDLPLPCTSSQVYILTLVHKMAISYQFNERHTQREIIKRINDLAHFISLQAFSSMWVLFASQKTVQPSDSSLYMLHAAFVSINESKVQLPA